MLCCGWEEENCFWCVYKCLRSKATYSDRLPPAASSCICLLCPWRPCSAYLILHSPPHFVFSQHLLLLLLSRVPFRVNFTGSKIKVENSSGDKDREKMKEKIKRAWNPLQSPYLVVCHHFVYIFYRNLRFFSACHGFSLSCLFWTYLVHSRELSNVYLHPSVISF